MVFCGFYFDFSFHISVGGIVSGMAWNKTGERLVVSFAESAVIAVFSTIVTPANLSISPIGFIRGELDETPCCFAYADQFNRGALLTIAWSSGRLQHLPMFFTRVPVTQDVIEPLSSSTSYLQGGSPPDEFAPRVYSSPAF